MSQVRPTIKDVARAARVHYSTVSLALRNHASIPAETRERIAKVAERIGYVRNPVLSALSSFRRQSQTVPGPQRIAYLVNRSPELGFNHTPYHEQFMAGAREGARSLGYEVETLFVAEDYHDSESLALYLREAGIRGLIIGAFEPGFSDLILDWDEYSVVKIDSLHIQPSFHLVSNDQLQVVRTAFQHMASLGYERIGLAVGRADEESSNHRHAAGFLIEQDSIPLERRVPILLFPHNVTMSVAQGLISRWIKRHQLDAVLCNWTNIDRMIELEGLSVPGDVACACLCLLDPESRVAGVVPHLKVVGEKAVHQVASLLRLEQRGIPQFPSTSYVQGRWQDGQSAPKKKR